MTSTTKARCNCDSPTCTLQHIHNVSKLNPFAPKRKLRDELTPSNFKKYRDMKFLWDTTCDTSDSEGGMDSESESQSELISFPPPILRSRTNSFVEIQDNIENIMKDFSLCDATYQKIMELLAIEMKSGLNKDTHFASTVRMFPTYVRSVPDGSESGRFLALDLGGTNFRVLRVDLKGSDDPELISKIFLIPKAVMTGTGRMLFNHIANCIARFMDSCKMPRNTVLPLGFTFSFPCYQDGIASARLVRWTKGFKCDGVVGEDVVELLHAALKRRGLNVVCSAVINDPVGALMSCAHKDKDCRIGLILGTGTNACYMEDLENVELWEEDRNEPKQVIINTEWGAFGDSGILEFIRNEFDHEMDKASLNPGHQLFEKMISGMYMGEICRLVLVKLTREGWLFDGRGSEELFTRQRFLSKYVSEIESDKVEDSFSMTKLVLQELEIVNYSWDDCRHVQRVCSIVSQRAAHLSAAGVATILNRLNRPHTTVAIDGSLYRFHPKFHNLMVEKITQLINPGLQFELTLAHDGSGRGAALVAAVTKRIASAQSSSTTFDKKEQFGQDTKNMERPPVSPKRSKMSNRFLSGIVEQNMETENSESVAIPVI